MGRSFMESRKMKLDLADLCSEIDGIAKICASFHIPLPDIFLAQCGCTVLYLA